eukprot:4018651-Amphidinium_carterae.2
MEFWNLKVLGCIGRTLRARSFTSGDWLDPVCVSAEMKSLVFDCLDKRQKKNPRRLCVEWCVQKHLFNLDLIFASFDMKAFCSA